MKLKKFTVLFMLLLLTTGCSMSSESPEQLIDEKPIYNEEKDLLYTEINKHLPENTSLLLPANSSEIGKINEVDLYNDGTEELIVFEKKENTNENTNEVGFMIFSKNSDGTYTEKDNYLQNGDTIEYANFYDLNSDGVKEIILLIKDSGITNMHIYQYKDDEISKICTVNPNWIKEERYSFTDMKIKIGYIDEDSILDILMINYSSETNKAYVSLVNFNQTLDVKDYVEFENIKGLNDVYITIGSVAPKKSGVILDLPIIGYGTTSSSYITQILYTEGTKLNKAFSDFDPMIFKPYYIPVEDVDNDKVLDIPSMYGNLNSYESKSSANISWYSWNGKTESDSRLVFGTQVYYNYQYNYKLFIPNILANKIDVRQQRKVDDILFKFYYYDNEGQEPKDLFTISIVNKLVIDDNKNGRNNYVLAENEEQAYILYVDDEKEMKKLMITTESLKDYFKLMY